MFDRSTRQFRWSPAGTELIHERQTVRPPCDQEAYFA